MKISPEQTIYFMISGSKLTMGSMSATMGQIYEQHKEEDGHLYMVYASQEFFGFASK